MKRKAQIDVSYIAKLANLSLTDKQKGIFTVQLESVLDYMSRIQALKTEGVTETSQVTGLQSITREDLVNKEQMLSQKEALRNARRTYNGFFVIPAIFK